MMRKRAVLGMGLICVLVAAVAGQAAGVPPSRQAMSGRTGQRYRIVLRAYQRTVEIRRFTIKLSCHDGSTLVDEESGFQKTPLRGGGRFRDDQVGSTDEVRIDGRLNGHGARGKVRVSDRLGGGVRCDSHWVRFTARAHR
jgi:hypothetical protein